VEKTISIGFDFASPEAVKPAKRPTMTNETTITYIPLAFMRFSFLFDQRLDNLQTPIC
jgi:hypothetical protein